MPPFRRSSLSLALCAALSVPPVAAADEAPVSASEKKVSDRATVGVRAGEHSIEGFADFIIPLWSTDDAVVFFNPRLSLADEGAQEVNVGFGVRKLWPEQKVIVGANAYYDNRFSAYNNTLSQFGAGLEFLSENVDARVNWYDADNDLQLTNWYETEQVDISMVRDWDNPYGKTHGIYQDYTDITTTTTTHRRYEQFEAGLDGYDAEVGAKLPLSKKAPQVKLFLGYYDYDNPFGDDIKGAKGRIEVKASDYLTLDAEVYENDDLNGSKYFVGARLNLPFDLSRLAAGKNPFKDPRKTRPATQFADRMNEMVIRDVRVQSAESDFMENEGAKTVDVQVDEQSGTETLLRDVIFVDGDNGSGVENGTHEHPYDTVQEGNDHAYGRKNVYVDEWSGIYHENVMLSSGVQLYGGESVVGGGGKRYRPGTMPTIDGDSMGPTITLDNNTSVRGFRLVNNSPILLGSNIYGHINISDNLFETSTGPAIVIGNANVPWLDLNIYRNRFDLGGGNLLLSIGSSSIGDTSVTLRDNTVDFNGGGGILTSGSIFSGGNLDFNVTGNQVYFGSGANFVFVGTMFTINGGDLNIAVDDNMMDFGDGANYLLNGSFFTADGGNLGVSISGNELRFGSGANYLFAGTAFTASGGDLAFNINRNQVDFAGSGLNYLFSGTAFTAIGGDLDFSMNHNQVNFAGSGSNFLFSGDVFTGIGGDLDFSMDHNQVDFDGTGSNFLFSGDVSTANGGDLAFSMDDNWVDFGHGGPGSNFLFSGSAYTANGGDVDFSMDDNAVYFRGSGSNFLFAGDAHTGNGGDLGFSMDHNRLYFGGDASNFVFAGTAFATGGNNDFSIDDNQINFASAGGSTNFVFAGATYAVGGDHEFSMNDNRVNFAGTGANFLYSGASFTDGGDLTAEIRGNDVTFASADNFFVAGNFYAMSGYGTLALRDNELEYGSGNNFLMVLGVPAGGSLCLDAGGNSVSAAGSPVMIDLSATVPGIIAVRDLGNLSADNGGASVTTSGNIHNVSGC
jgi:hypothetical protein